MLALTYLIQHGRVRARLDPPEQRHRLGFDPAPKRYDFANTGDGSFGIFFAILYAALMDAVIRAVPIRAPNLVEYINLGRMAGHVQQKEGLMKGKTEINTGARVLGPRDAVLSCLASL